MSEQTPTNISNADFTFKDKYGNTGSNKGISTDDGTKLNNMVKLINLMLNTPNSTDFINTLATKQYVDENQSSGLIPNQIIQSPVPLTDANLHLLDGALLSGLGVYADYVAMMADLYNADPTATCWTDEATWQASVTQYGECGKFVYDSVNNTLRLPKLTSFVQATTTASELGSLVEAGAPNIVGEFYASVRNTAPTTTTGAFGFTKTNSCSSTGSTLPSGTLSFDASDSNSIYGNSNTIQPQAIKYYFYIVVGTVSKTQIQIDIDNVMADLALKADKDFSNVTAPTQAFKNMSIGWGQPDYTSAIVITLTLNTAVSYIAPDDGFIIYTLTGMANTEAFITVNEANVVYFSSAGGAYTVISSGIVPVHQGDMIKIKATGLDSGWMVRGHNYAEFVPCKGV